MGAGERDERPFELHPAVRASIAQLLATENWLAHPDEADGATVPEGDRVVSLEAVEACEEAVDGQLGDDVIAMLTCESPFLSEQYGMRLGMVGAHTDEAREEGLPKSRVAIGKAGKRWVAVERKPTPENRQRLFLFDGDLGEEERVEIARFLMDAIEYLVDDIELEEAVLGSIEAERNVDRFAPCFERTTRSEAGPTRRVRHGKFGEGTVLRELRDGAEPKLMVRFDDGAEKTLLARFLQDA